MGRSRTALAVAAGIAAGASVVAVAAIAAPHRGSTQATGAADPYQAAVSQVLGTSASAAPSASGAGSGKAGGPGGRHQGGMGGGLGGGLGVLGGQVLHGVVTVQGKDGKAVEVTVQRGTVSTLTSGGFTVRSSDGFTQTWTTSSDTRFLLGSFGMGARGPRPAPSGSASTKPSSAPSSTPSQRSLAKGDVVLVVGSASGSSAAARLVVAVPDNGAPGGLGGGGFRPHGGMGGPHWGMRGPGGSAGAPGAGTPPSALPKPSGSPA